MFFLVLRKIIMEMPEQQINGELFYKRENERSIRGENICQLK